MIEDELGIKPISVLSESDRQTIQDARRWLRYLFNQDKDLDKIEREGIFELIERLNALYAQTAAEGQLAEIRSAHHD